jgi:hypothetical protein
MARVAATRFALSLRFDIENVARLFQFRESRPKKSRSSLAAGTE